MLTIILIAILLGLFLGKIVMCGTKSKQQNQKDIVILGMQLKNKVNMVIWSLLAIEGLTWMKDWRGIVYVTIMVAYLYDSWCKIVLTKDGIGQIDMIGCIYDIILWNCILNYEKDTANVIKIKYSKKSIFIEGKCIGKVMKLTLSDECMVEITRQLDEHITCAGANEN
ncbi:MAG: hypothetical protein AB9856_05375 [Cellulosilyticaceae bacterium]